MLSGSGLSRSYSLVSKFEREGFLAYSCITALLEYTNPCTCGQGLGARDDSFGAVHDTAAAGMTGELGVPGWVDVADCCGHGYNVMLEDLEVVFLGQNGQYREVNFF